MTGSTGQRVASLAAAAVVWELAARALDTPLLPPFSAILSALGGLARNGELAANLAVSLGALAAGFAIAVGVGVPIGAWMGSSRRVERVLDPYLSAGLAAPALIWVPVLFAIGGTSRAMHVATVFLYSVFAITSYTLEGIRAVNPSLVEMAHSFGATRRQIFWRVAWPGSQPMLATGLRVGAGLAVKGMVNGEMLLAATGIGALIRTYGGRFEPDKVLALLLVVIVVALAVTSIIRKLERRTTSGTIGTSGTKKGEATKRLIDVLPVLAAEGLALPVGMVLAALLARRLGVDGYGVFAIAMSVVSGAEWLLTALFSRATIKAIGESGAWQLVAAPVIRWHLIGGLAASTAIWIAATPLAAAMGEPRLKWCLILLACEIPFVTVAAGYRNVLTGRLRFSARAWTSVARWLSLLVCVTLAVLLSGSLSGAALGNVAGATVSVFLMRAFVGSVGARSPSRPASRAFWAVALPAFLLALSLRLLDKIGLVALKLLGASIGEVGWYAAAQNFSVAPGLLAVSFSPLLLAQMSGAIGRGHADAARDLGRDALRLIVAGAPFAALAAGSAGEIIRLIYGRGFDPAAALATPFLVAALAVMLISIASAILTAAGRARAASRCTWPILPLAIVGYLLVVPRFGPIGAAWITAASAAIGAALSLATVFVAWRVAPPLATLVRSLVLCIPAYAVAAMWTTPGGWWVVKAAVVCAGIIVGFMLLGELSSIERRALVVGLRRSSTSGRGAV